MNVHKMRVIQEHVRRQGRLPTDQWGNPLSPDDLLVWFGLSKLLSAQEQIEVKRELIAMAEAEALVDTLNRQSS